MTRHIALLMPLSPELPNAGSVEYEITGAVRGQAGSCFEVWKFPDGRTRLEAISEGHYRKLCHLLSAQSPEAQPETIAGDEAAPLAVRMRQREIIGTLRLPFGIMVLEISGEKEKACFQRLSSEKYRALIQEFQAFEAGIVGSGEEEQQQVSATIRNIWQQLGQSADLFVPIVTSFCRHIRHTRSLALALLIATAAAQIANTDISAFNVATEAPIQSPVSTESRITTHQPKEGERPPKASPSARVLSFPPQNLPLPEPETIPSNRVQQLLEEKEGTTLPLFIPTTTIGRNTATLTTKKEDFPAAKLAAYHARAQTVLDAHFRGIPLLPTAADLIAQGWKETRLIEDEPGPDGEIGAFQITKEALQDVKKHLKAQGYAEREYDLENFEDNLFVALQLRLIYRPTLINFLAARGVNLGKNMSVADFLAIENAMHNAGIGRMQGMLGKYLRQHSAQQSLTWEDFSRYWLQEVINAEASGNTSVVYTRQKPDPADERLHEVCHVSLKKVRIICQYGEYIDTFSQQLLRLAEESSQERQIAA